VPRVRLDDALADQNAFMIKLDVEGYELDVLRGGEGTLRNPALQALVVEINDAGKNYGRADDEVLGMISAYGFERVAYAPFERRLVAATGKVPAGASNAIFVRDRAAVQARLQSAPAFRVLDQRI
jgi:hypothetical protein